VLVALDPVPTTAWSLPVVIAGRCPVPELALGCQ